MKSIIITSFFGAALCAVVIGCDVFFTSVPEKGETFDQPLDGLTREQQLAFARGDAAFEKVFSFNEGLGPLFVQPSCESCRKICRHKHQCGELLLGQKIRWLSLEAR